MKCLNISGNLIYCDIELNLGPRAKLMDYVQKGHIIRHVVRDECAVMSVPLTGKFEATRGDVVGLVHGREPAD